MKPLSLKAEGVEEKNLEPSGRPVPTGALKAKGRAAVKQRQGRCVEVEKGRPRNERPKPKIKRSFGTNKNISNAGLDRVLH